MKMSILARDVFGALTLGALVALYLVDSAIGWVAMVAFAVFVISRSQRASDAAKAVASNGTFC
jgi:hypothetical protein